MKDVKELESNSPVKNPFIKKATINDHETVINILCSAFRNDPHMAWLLEKSKNPNKLQTMMSYLFYKTLKIGEIHLTKDEQAVALWKSDKKEKLTLEYIRRNFMFLMNIGLTSVIRILGNENFTYKQYPKRQIYHHLYLVGVRPECQGKGYASRLLNPVLEKMSKKSIPVYLETANVTNVKIYEKKGFQIYNLWVKPGLELYYMKKTR